MSERRTTSKIPLIMEELFYGVGSAAAAKTLTAPLNRIKLILQTQKLLIMEDNRRYQGLSDAYLSTNSSPSESSKPCFTLLEIRREQGIISFWRGNGLDVIKAIPTTTLKFLSYDFFKRYFKNSNSQPSVSNLHPILEELIAIVGNGNAFQEYRMRISIRFHYNYTFISD